jgi:hypothetical protein
MFKEFFMLKKSILAIALLAVGLAVVPQVQAQTRQQQRELEQIAMRSMNGLSAQDRQRVIQIMTDVYVAQGMSRTQAAQFAEMAADSMFTSDVGEMSAEQRRQFEEQERSLAELEQRQNQPQQPQPQQQKQLGETAGWPPASAFQTYYKLSPLTQPAGTIVRYTSENEFRNLEIYLTGGNSNTVLRNLKQQIERITGRQMSQEGNDYFGFIQDPNYRSQDNSIRFWLNLENNVVKLQINPVAG